MLLGKKNYTCMPIAHPVKECDYWLSTAHFQRGFGVLIRSSSHYFRFAVSFTSFTVYAFYPNSSTYLSEGSLCQFQFLNQFKKKNNKCLLREQNLKYKSFVGITLQYCNAFTKDRLAIKAMPINHASFPKAFSTMVTLKASSSLKQT